MATATFVITDTTTEGKWVGVYGSDGYTMAAGPQSLPAYATFSFVGGYTWIWAATSTDSRALVSGSTGLAACWYSATTFTLDVNLTDGNTHQVALYAVNWDSQARSETITITDAVSGAVLSTETIPPFSDGVWLVWNISGSVIFTVTNNNSSVNAVVSGLFFAPASSVASPPTTGSGYMVVMVTTPPPPSHSAVLAWQPVASATEYNVYRGAVSGGPYTKLTATPLTSPSYIDPTVVAGTTYFYTTTSIVSGVESSYSTQVPVSIPTP
jgi:hypothetical protein